MFKNDPYDCSHAHHYWLQIILAVLSAIIILTLTVCLLRGIRRRHPEPRYIPTPYLKQLWSKWQVSPSGSTYHHTSLHDHTDVDADTTSSQRRPSRVRMGSAAFEDTIERQSQQASGNATVDRNTSIRSIMTLPAYRQKPTDNEQVLGREGERDGVDVVVEFPTAEDAEEMREEEMETLYQIRLARRQEIADRDERRRLRREARDNGDVVALEELRERARAASNNSLVDELRRDHERIKDQRNRAVPSVSYAELGVARHDGSRLRANSSESERVGLLSDTASIAAVSTRSGATSSAHRRGRSGSVLSVDSDLASPGLPRSRASSRADTIRLSVGTRTGSRAEVDGADLGEEDMPPHSPPGYDVVSLDDARSGATTPNEPPPDYSGPRNMTDRSPPVDDEEADLGRSDSGDRGQSRNSMTRPPRLPSLRLQQLPQIIVEPSPSSGRPPQLV